MIRQQLFYQLLYGVLSLFSLQVFASVAFADMPEYEITIRNHLFHPSTLVVPAHTKVKLVIYNQDNTAEEFESYELNREKVIIGGHKAAVFIGPLDPGVYPYFGEFNPRTAQGIIVSE